MGCTYDLGGVWTLDTALPEKLAGVAGIPGDLSVHKQPPVGETWSTSEKLEHEKNSLAYYKRSINKAYPAGTNIAEIVREWTQYDINCLKEKPVVCKFNQIRTLYGWDNVIVFGLPQPTDDYVRCISIWTTFVHLTLHGEKQLEHIKIEKQSHPSSCDEKSDN